MVPQVTGTTHALQAALVQLAVQYPLQLLLAGSGVSLVLLLSVIFLWQHAKEGKSL